MKKSLLPRILETKQLYQNPHVTCCIDTVSRGTNTWEQFYFYGTLPVSGAFVVPFEDKYIYMLQQHRYASNQYFWEFPGGKGGVCESVNDAHKVKARVFSPKNRK
jgi:hypothetical protein